MRDKQVLSIPPPWFDPRPAQLSKLEALDRGVKKFLSIWPRRGGKDVSDLVCASKVACDPRSPQGQFWYLFPEKSQGRAAIWDGMTKNGEKYIDILPYDPASCRKLENEMRMEFLRPDGTKNLFRIEDAARPDSLVGGNPIVIVISEYALPGCAKVLDYLRPILRENDGWLFINSTVRGKNHLWRLYNAVKDDPEWHVSYHTDRTYVDWDGTPIVTEDAIQREIQQGMSKALADQEFRNNWEGVSEGTYYLQEMQQVIADGRIGDTVWRPEYKVHTAWDIGINDPTVVLFFQVIEDRIYIIDMLYGSDHGLAHWCAQLNRGHRSKYIYGMHFAPHDMANRDYGTGVERYRVALDYGIRFNPIPPHKNGKRVNLSVDDGIELGRQTLPLCFFSRTNCAILIEALKHYSSKETGFFNFDGSPIYSAKPDHDENSDPADAFRYLSIGFKYYLKGRQQEKLASHKPKVLKVDF